MGGISACGVDKSRLASVEHTFKPPPISDLGSGEGVGSNGNNGSGSGQGDSTSGPPPPRSNAGSKSSVALNGGGNNSTGTGSGSSNNIRSNGGGSSGIGRKKTSVVGPPPAPGTKRVAEVHDIVGIEDGDIATRAEEDQGGARLGLLGMMASAIRETDPQESAAIEDLARKLVGREYFLDPRVFNHSQVL